MCYISDIPEGTENNKSPRPWSRCWHLATFGSDFFKKWNKALQNRVESWVTSASVPHTPHLFHWWIHRYFGDRTVCHHDHADPGHRQISPGLLQWPPELLSEMVRLVQLRRTSCSDRRVKMSLLSRACHRTPWQEQVVVPAYGSH